MRSDLPLHKYERRLTVLRRSLVQKRAVQARHQPGTSHHTRATREADALVYNINEIEAILRKRAKE